MFLNCNAIVCAWFYPMLVPLLCIKDNSIGVILANHNQENWTWSTRSFSSHGLIIIPIIWSLILKANYIHFLFRKLPLQKNNSGIWHIYLLLTVPGHKFYLKNNILTISINTWKKCTKGLRKRKSIQRVYTIWRSLLGWGFSSFFATHAGILFFHWSCPISS